MIYYVTNEHAQFAEKESVGTKAEHEEMKFVKVYDDIEKQTIVGFGGALTEASAYVWSQMAPEKQEEIINLYYGEEGNRYTLGRVHIQSCDFALGNRAYVEEGDKELSTFSIEGDYQYQISLIKAAIAKNPNLELLASPWSPPAFMKSNNEMNHGGRLLEEYYDAWASLMVKFLLAYREEGIVINRISVQNEPAAVQTWDSCVYTAQEEGIFATNCLRKKLDEAGLTEVKIFIWDHNKESLIDRCRGTFSVEGADEAIDGIAFHWYSGDHFESVQYIADEYKDKELLFSEGCVEFSRFSDASPTDNALMYAHDIMGNLRAGMNGYLDWNIILDEKGGPNHVGNFCDAPIMCNAKTGEIDVHLTYYYIGHFSRFVQPGAVRVLTSCYDRNLETAAFKNPDGSKAVVVLNMDKTDKAFRIMDGDMIYDVELPAQSILTACVK